MMIRPNKKVGFILPMPRERAFTLAELLIATGITAIIVVLFGTMLGSLLSTASRASQRIDAFREARAALQMMERDLSNLVRAQWNPDPFTNPTPTPGTVQPVTRPAAYFALDNLYTDTATGNQQLYALVAAKPTASGTPCPTPNPSTSPAPPPCFTDGQLPIVDVCAVGYYCRWDDQLHAYSLRRFFRDNCNTLCVMQNAGSYAADSALYTPGPSDPVLAAYVWNLKVTMYDASGAVINTYPYICDPDGTTPKTLPAAIEISFSAMSAQAARTVRSLPNADATTWMTAVLTSPSPSPTPPYQGLILPHTHQFRTRINFQ